MCLSFLFSNSCFFFFFGFLNLFFKCINKVSFIQKILIKKCVAFSLFNKNITINLYKLYFLSFYFFLNQINKFFIPLFFHISNQTHIIKNYIFFTLSLFYSFFFLCPNFLLFQPNRLLVTSLSSIGFNARLYITYLLKWMQHDYVRELQNPTSELANNSCPTSLAITLLYNMYIMQ